MMLLRFKYCFTLLLLSLLCITAFAQSKKYDKQEKKLFLEGDSYYVYGDFLTATTYFEQLYPVDSSDAEINFIMGDAYYQLDQYKEALPYLKKGAAYNTDAHYLRAKIYLHEAKFDQMQAALGLFEQHYDSRQSSFNAEFIQRLKEQASVAKKMMANPEVLNIINLGPKVNSDQDEYVPLITSDESILYFTSRRLHENNTLDPRGEPFEDIYRTEKAEGEWTEAQLVDEINTETHDAAVGLSPDGQRLYTFKPNNNLIGGDLYESIKKEGKWTKPIRLESAINKYESIERSASLALDGKTFYFSSNREGGFGGFDLYRVKMLPNGQWSEAKNLGPDINTAFDEDAPFIHPDGITLYFSSKGHENMGGFDLFKASLIDQEQWTSPENLGFPTNTTKDDIFFVISANEQKAYYAANKSGGFGGHDIYMIDYLERDLRQSVIRAKVLDATSNEPLSADISLVELESGELTGVYRSRSEDGGFIFLVNPGVEYDLMIELEGYEEQMEIILYEKEALMKEQSLTFKLNPLSK